jgi:tetratricopeptide (TPR) repeat protein
MSFFKFALIAGPVLGASIAHWALCQDGAPAARGGGEAAAPDNPPGGAIGQGAAPGALQNFTQIVVSPFHGPDWDYYHYGPYHYPPYYYHYPGPLVYGPVFVPPGFPFGPNAIHPYMGIHPFRQPVVPNIIVLNKDDGEDADEKRQQRATNDRVVALGWKFIGYGDAHFENQRYAEAYQRYRKAVQVAPRLAAAHFRQGFACTATGRYELAAQAFRRGLEFEPDWPSSDFRVDEIYGPNRLAKTSHLNALAQAASNDPHNGDLLFLVGVRLYFDDQQERAKKFFQRAADLGVGIQDQARLFLDAIDGGDKPNE